MELYAQNEVKYLTISTAPEKAVALYRKAKEDIEFYKVDNAIKSYQKAIKEAPTFIEAHIQLGGLYFGQKKYELAISTLKTAYAMDPTFNPQVSYTIGVAYWELDDYDAALPYLDACLAMEKSPKELKSRANKIRQDCIFSKQAVLYPFPFTPIPLPSSINTIDAEILPTLSTDGKSLIFVRRGQSEDLYESRMIDSVWLVAEPIVSINSKENEGSQVLSADGNTMIFTRCNAPDGMGSCDLYWTKRQGSGWSKPKNLGAPINTGGWEGQPAISNDGRLLIFSSERANGHGGKDLWISSKEQSGKWSVPRNLGDTINTVWDEQAPFLHPDGKTLYFTSEGHPGLGQADIFMSKQIAENTWDTPINLGYPINSKGHDGTIYVLADGKSAYFATDRLTVGQGLERPNLDIFSFILPSKVRAEAIAYVQGTVADAKTKKPLRASIEVTVRGKSSKPWNLTSDSLRGFLLTLPSDQTYSMQIQQPGYLFYSAFFAPGAENSAINPYHLAVELTPIASIGSKGDTLALNNLFFASNSAQILPESEHELTKILDIMKQMPDLKVEIIGHTDSIGQEASNLKLSKQRAEEVMNFLVAKGIAKEKLSAIGLGEQFPVAPNSSSEGRQGNRRTEFRFFIKPE